MAALLIVIAAATPASSFLIPGERGVGGDIDYFTMDSGDAGLIVTESGIELDNHHDGMGLATSAQYWFGDHDDPTNVFAFTFTHHLEGDHRLVLRFDDVNTAFDAVDNIKFSVYERGGGFVGAVSDESNELRIDAGPADTTYFVVVMVDTHGIPAGENIRGVFSVTAVEVPE